MPSLLEDDVTATGDWTFSGTLTLPANTFGDGQANSSSPLAGNKTKHRHKGQLSQVHGTACADERRYVHRAKAAGTINEFKALIGVAITGDSTVTVDLKKSTGGGAPATVLSGTISFSNADAINVAKTGTIVSPSYIAGDIFEVVVDATVGTGTLPQELFASGEFEELPS